MFGRCQNLSVLIQMMKLYFELERVNTRDLDSQMAFVGLVPTKDKNPLIESSLDLFYQLLAISIADKLNLNEQFVPLYSTQDIGIIAQKTFESMPIDTTEEELDSIAMITQELYQKAMDSVRIFSKECGNEYEVFWQWIDALTDIMIDFNFTDVSQVPVTIEIYDDLIRRLYTKERYSNLIDIIHQSIGGDDTLWKSFESSFAAEGIEITDEISEIIESSIQNIQNQLNYIRDYLLTRIYSN